MSKQFSGSSDARRNEFAGTPRRGPAAAVVPALPASSRGETGGTKDVSGDARRADSVPTLGWVDHDIRDVNGDLFPVHTPGVILFAHPSPDPEKDQDQDEPKPKEEDVAGL